MFDKLGTIRFKHIVVMPDFFIDRIVRLNGLDSLMSEVNRKIRVGGGSIRGVKQEEIKGGNAVNVSYALARLGAGVSLITVADDLGRNVLENTFAPFKKTELLIAKGKQGYTLSLESGDSRRRANVMISDVGDVRNFGPEKLGARELKSIRRASAVVVTNWASNRHGTELASKAFRSSRKDALCFLDPADISERKDEFRLCLDAISQQVEVLSINENECRLTMKSLNLSPLAMNYSHKDIPYAAKALASKLSMNVDLHTPIGSATSNGKETSYAKSLNVEVAVSTGAGDIWDAADIAGYLCSLDDEERLMFANLCAAIYVSRIESPTLLQASRFLRSTK